MPSYRTPGVYIEEISTLPPSVAEVGTAIPAFVGYTQKASSPTDSDLRDQPTRITSFADFEQIFGPAYPVELSVEAGNDDTGKFKLSVGLHDPGYILWHCMKLFFDNGGGACYVVSVGSYSEIPEFSTAKLRLGLDAIRKQDEPTLIVIPEMVYLDEAGFAEVAQAMLQQCSVLRDRFAILDIRDGETDPDDVDWPRQRALFGSRYLEYGAAYFPFLTKSGYLSGIEDDEVIVRYKSSRRSSSTLPVSKWKEINVELFNAVKRDLNTRAINLPPSAALAGIYSATDSTRGVWKAPANISVNSIRKPAVDISHEQQEPLNVDPVSGKSINAIRDFPGRGSLVWGARTLAGNDPEWRYVSVRRFAIMIEESLCKSTQWAVFEPNDANTWTRVRAMIVNYLTDKWRDGALAGAKPDDAFFVQCGLGTTMTQQDINEGRLIIQVGLAMVRPAEFIVLRFEQKMQTS